MYVVKKCCNTVLVCQVDGRCNWWLLEIALVRGKGREDINKRKMISMHRTGDMFWHGNSKCDATCKFRGSQFGANVSECNSCPRKLVHLLELSVCITVTVSHPVDVWWRYGQICLCNFMSL